VKIDVYKMAEEHVASGLYI